MYIEVGGVFTARSVCPWRKSLQYPLDMRVGEWVAVREQHGKEVKPWLSIL
jgi:hypothetical protein